MQGKIAAQIPWNVMNSIFFCISVFFCFKAVTHRFPIIDSQIIEFLMRLLFPLENKPTTSNSNRLKNALYISDVKTRRIDRVRHIQNNISKSTTCSFKIDVQAGKINQLIYRNRECAEFIEWMILFVARGGYEINFTLILIYWNEFFSGKCSESLKFPNIFNRFSFRNQISKRANKLHQKSALFST